MKQFIINLIYSNSGAVVITTAFCAVWIVGWTCKALYGLKFDLLELQGMYQTVIVPHLGFHATNSWLNSDKGKMP